MYLLGGFAILLMFQFLGELLTWALRLPVPGNVVGMVLFFLGLRTGLVPLRAVERVADGLLAVLALLFVPPGVGLVLYLDLLQAEWLPIAAGTVISTYLVLAVTGLSAQHGLRRTAK